MSAKHIHTLTDANPDLQKRIGWMNGILQLFDRQHFICSRRVNHKRLPPPGEGVGDQDDSEINSVFHYIKGENPKKGTKERHRFSSESSRTSFSSSPSSTFSSLDCNKIVPPETSSACQSLFPDTLVRNHSLKQFNASPQFRLQSPDIRDVVKDSINREACSMSVKTSPKHTVSHKLKHVDSPRPSQPSKPVKPRASSLHESLRGTGKLKEDPCGYRGGMQGRRYMLPKDAPRFSYDERESRDASKSGMKLRELPRLSLDSRTSTLRNSASSYVKGMGNQNNSIDEKFGQEPGSNKRPPSIVAKLMGLDVVPDVMPTKERNIMPSELQPNGDLLNASHKGYISSFPSSTPRDPIANQSRTAGSIMKTTSTLRIPIEPAPWRQTDPTRGPQKHNSNGGAVTKAPNSVPSVYGEIEKRLTELEFKKSSKDLRALKQILGAMQKTKEILESKRDNQVADTLSQTSNSSSNQSSHHQNSGVEIRGNLHGKDHISIPTRGGNSPRTNRSEAVIGRTGKGGRTSNNQAPSARPIEGLSNLQKIRTSSLTNIRKDFLDRHMARDQTPKSHLPRETSSPSPRVTDKNSNPRTLRLQTSRVPPHDRTGNSLSSGRSSGAVSPSLQEKHSWLENQPHPPTPLSARRQSARQQAETSSLGRKTPQKSSLQKFGYHSNQEADSLPSDRIVTLSPRIDIKVTSSSHSADIGSFSQTDHKSDILETRPRKLRSLAELATVTPEQPSPISVLDAMFCAEDLPSPVKKTSIALQDDDTYYSDEPRWSEADLTYTSKQTKSILGFGIDQKKLENVQLLVQQLRKLSCSSNDSCTGYTSLLFDSRNKDHRYVYRILSASGLLQDLTSGLIAIQLHASKQVIDPKLFLVLEQIGAQTISTEYNSNETSLQTMDSERIQRKFIFDAVNEILVRQVALASSGKAWSLPNTQEGKNQICQRLFTELCSEIDQLQSSNAGRRNEEFDYDSITNMLLEDLKQQPQNWTDSRDEISGLVLDVERLIFKDLINEIVIGGFTSKRARPSGPCRKLF